MKYLSGLLVAIVVSLSAGAVAAAQTPSPTATQTAVVPTPTAPASATPTPVTPVATSTSPAPSPTANPPTINGIQCKSGTLLHGFLIIGRDDVPPGCSVRTAATGPQVIYGLTPSPEYAFLAAGTDRFGVVSVEYVSTRGPLAGTPGAITISLQPTYDNPPLIQTLQGQVVSSANYLPSPGVALPNIEVPEAFWIGPSGYYTLSVDPRLTSLTLEDVAARLTPIQLPAATTPQPPTTGNGRDSTASSRTLILLLEGTALMSVGLMLGIVSLRRKRFHRS